MNYRKPILYILLIVLGLILIYNYLIAPSLMQYNYGMGMGMHGAMHRTNNYLVDFSLILLITVIIAGLLLVEFVKSEPKYKLCKKCGKTIESDSWRICPLCGAPVNRGESL